MKKSVFIIAVFALCLLTLTGCFCEHVWVEADCVTAKTCSECQETTGTALGHQWNAATCDTARTCVRCSQTEGDPLGHDWSAATCDTAKVCNRCGQSEGEPLGHTPGECREEPDVLAATMYREQFCSVCNTLMGSETVSLNTFIQEDLFLFTPAQFMERWTQIAQQDSFSFTYEFVSTTTGLQAHVLCGDKMSMVQFFRSDTSTMGNDEKDVAEVWCVSLISMGEASSELRCYFYMACDPTLDPQSAYTTDVVLVTNLFNANAELETTAYYLQNQLLYENALYYDQDINLYMVNIYASDFRQPYSAPSTGA